MQIQQKIWIQNTDQNLPKSEAGKEASQEAGAEDAKNLGLANGMLH